VLSYAANNNLSWIADIASSCLSSVAGSMGVPEVFSNPVVSSIVEMVVLTVTLPLASSLNFSFSLWTVLEGSAMVVSPLYKDCVPTL